MSSYLGIFLLSNFYFSLSQTLTSFETKDDCYILSINYSYTDFTHYSFCFAICVEFENGDYSKVYCNNIPSDSTHPINLINNYLF